MDSVLIAQAMWFSKIAQFISAVLLTPEIIGPDRLAKLGKHIRSRTFNKKKADIYLGLVFAAVVFLLPMYFVFTVIAIDGAPVGAADEFGQRIKDALKTKKGSVRLTVEHLGKSRLADLDLSGVKEVH